MNIINFISYIFQGFITSIYWGQGRKKGPLEFQVSSACFLFPYVYLSKIGPRPVMFSWTRFFFEKPCRPQIEMVNSHLNSSRGLDIPLGNLIRFVQMQIPTKRQQGGFWCGKFIDFSLVTVAHFDTTVRWWQHSSARCQSSSSWIWQVARCDIAIHRGGRRWKFASVWPTFAHPMAVMPNNISWNEPGDS